MNVEVTFLEHILPQFISLFVVGITFIFSYRYYYTTDFNRYNIGTIALASLLLIYGKISLFLFHNNPDIVKMHVDTSLLVYFAVMPLVLTRLAKINRKVQIFLQIGMIPLLAALLSTDYIQSKIIFSADMYLVFILLFSSLKSKWWLIGSFTLLGIINLLTCYFARFWSVYAWVEVIGQLLFLAGFLTLKQEVD